MNTGQQGGVLQTARHCLCTLLSCPATQFIPFAPVNNSHSVTGLCVTNVVLSEVADCLLLMGAVMLQLLV
jgi:hypothetical protein